MFSYILETGTLPETCSADLNGDGLVNVLDIVLVVNIADLSSLLKIGSLVLIIVCCKIIYLGMIFMLKVLTIQDLKGYIKK